MRKNLWMMCIALIVILTGCDGEKKPAPDKKAVPDKESMQTTTSKQQNILDYTKILKLGEPLDVTDPQSYQPNTIEYAVWHLNQSMMEKNFQEARNYLSDSSDNGDPALNMTYENIYRRIQWDLNKPATLTLRQSGENYFCTFEGFSNIDKKNRNLSYYIVIRKQKVILAYGKQNNTFE